MSEQVEQVQVAVEQVKQEGEVYMSEQVEQVQVAVEQVKQEGVVSKEIIEMAKKILEKQEKALEKTRANLQEKYPHAKMDTLEYDAEAKKYSVEISCVECGGVRRVYTSDLFQIQHCTECSKTVRAEKRKEKKDLLKAAMKALKEGKLEL